MKRALVLVALAGCGGKPAAPETKWEPSLVAESAATDEVVATVDGRPIHASDVATQAREKGTTTRVALDDLVTAELLAGEAARRHLDRDPEAREAARRDAVLRLLQRGFEAEATPAAIPEKIVRRTYFANINMFDHSEYADVWHILAPVPEKPKPEDKARARAIAEDLAKRARGVKSAEAFKQLAGETTLPAGQAPLKVERIVTARDGWVLKEFSYAAFDQLKKPGDTSTVVETSYGFHVMYLNQYIPPLHRSIADASAELRAGIFRNWQKGEFVHWVDELKKQHAVAMYPEHLK
jgi:hypothetical protein